MIVGAKPQPIELPPTSTAVRGLVFTDFFEGEYKSSQTQSANIVALRESMEVRDISADLAAIAREKGIPSRALKNADTAQLRPGEVLVRGTAMKTRDIKTGPDVAAVVLTSVTALVIGEVLPLPFPIPYRCGYKYKLEMSDSDGEIIASVPNREYMWNYKTLYTFSTSRACEKRAEPMHAEFQRALVGAVIDAVELSDDEQFPAPTPTPASVLAEEAASPVLDEPIAVSDPPPPAPTPEPPPAPGDDLAAFDAGFRTGQQQFDNGAFLKAAQSWTAAAAGLTENEANKDNLVAVHEYIADAYQKAVDNGARDSIKHEALAVLDAYVERFTAAHPGEEPPPRVMEVRTAIRATLPPPPPPAAVDLDDLPPAASRQSPPMRRAKPQRRAATSGTGRGLIGSGATLIGLGAASLGVMGAGMGMAANAANELPQTQPLLRDEVFDRGATGNAMAVTGGAAAGLFLATGIGLLSAGVVKRKRSRQSTLALTPMWIGTGATFSVAGRF